MNKHDRLLTLLVGAAAATAFHLSCGDGESPAPADAATECECPVAETPLLPRLTRVTAREEIMPNMADSVAAGCVLGEIAISGGCRAGSLDSKHILNSSFPSPPETPVAWACRFYNGTASPVTSEAYVLCLKPAP
jgi:hypothetical protein